MNTSPWLEIIVIVAVLAFFGALIGNYVYRKKHHLPTGDCAACHSHSLVDDYHKAHGCKQCQCNEKKPD